MNEVPPIIPELRTSGFNVVSGHKDKKHPNVNWKDYQTDFVSDNAFDRMCTTNKNTGLWCVITGAVSNNLVVVDVDSPDVYNTFFKKYEEKTIVVETPSGGKHLWFKCDTVPKNSAGHNGFPVDIRGAGGVVVAPGSVSSKGAYKFINKHELKPMEIKKVSDVLASIPAKKEVSFSGAVKKFIGSMNAVGFDIYNVMHLLGVTNMVAGSHGDYKCPCMIHHSKTGEPLEIYVSTGSYYCHGCHATGDVIDITKEMLGVDFNSAVKHLEEMSGIKSDIPEHRDLHAEMDDTFVCDRLQWVKTAPTEHLMQLSDDYAMINKNGKFDVEAFINWLMYKSGEHFVTLKDMHGTTGVMRYNNGAYKRFGIQDAETITDLLLTPYTIVKPFHHGEIATSVKAKTYGMRADFDTDENIINMRNGLYNIHTNMLTPHTPEYKSFLQTDIDYDPDAKCPAIDKFIRDLVNEKDVQLIYEIMGYIYRNKKLMKTAFIFLGAHNSGKSKLLDLIRVMIGRQNVSAVSATMLANTIFGAAEVADKLANIVDDLGNTTLADTGLLKSVIYGGSINVQKKGGQLYDIIPKCVLVYATNNLPKTRSDNEDAFKSRFQIIDFPNRFEGTKDGENSKRDDKHILDKITTPEELSGFFNKAMTAMSDVDVCESFTGSERLDERVRRYDYASNSLYRFFDKKCIFDRIGAELARDTLYGYYHAWCDKYHLHRETKGAMTTLLGEEKSVPMHRPRNSDGDQVKTYRGIAYRDDEPL